MASTRRFGAFLAVVALGTLAGRAFAQAPSVEALDDPFTTGGLGIGSSGEMSALLEVTIFNIDVLTLTVRFSPEVGRKLGSLVDGREYSEALADSVAAVMLSADDLWARQVFHRDVGFGRLLGGMRESSERAADAGFISRAYFEEFSANLPVWFGFLEADGAKKGDQIVFWIRDGSLRTVYRSADGVVQLDKVGFEPEAIPGSIPSFFAPGSRFRKRLVESLLAAPNRVG